MSGYVQMLRGTGVGYDVNVRYTCGVKTFISEEGIKEKYTSILPFIFEEGIKEKYTSILPNIGDSFDSSNPNVKCVDIYTGFYGHDGYPGDTGHDGYPSIICRYTDRYKFTKDNTVLQIQKPGYKPYIKGQNKEPTKEVDEVDELKEDK